MCHRWVKVKLACPWITVGSHFLCLLFELLLGLLGGIGKSWESLDPEEDLRDFMERRRAVRVSTFGPPSPRSRQLESLPAHHKHMASTKREGHMVLNSQKALFPMASLVFGALQTSSTVYFSLVLYKHLLSDPSQARWPWIKIKKHRGGGGAISTFSPVGSLCSNGLRMCVCMCLCIALA